MNVLVGICNADGHIQSAVFVQHVQMEKARRTNDDQSI